MADFTNRQLAEIITQAAEKIQGNVLKERKIANELSLVAEKIESQIFKLESTSIEPDLSKINSFYEEKTEENIKVVNSHLKVPNLILYFGLGSVILLIISAFCLYLAYSSAFKTKQDIISEYHEELLKEKAIISKEDKLLLEDMTQWFMKNSKNKNSFLQYRQQKNPSN
ncbi:hypothetical protein CMT75_18930 [Elizabethkingia anophelis]|nr:hypothetical protein [Elizabethkingia anophelis]